MARDRERTKARIVDAVCGLLTRSGFRAVGVNAVAEAAGVDKVLIYRYFGEATGGTKSPGGSSAAAKRPPIATSRPLFASFLPPSIT